jgi:hypothetical protein
LDYANENQHGGMYTSSRQCAADDGYDRCGDQTPSSTDSVSKWSASKSTEACPQEEECIDSTKDVVGILCSWPSLREIKVGVEARLADTGGEGCEA